MADARERPPEGRGGDRVQSNADGGTRERLELGYQPGLDGVRGLGIAAVVLHHARRSLAPGAVAGLDAFLVLSGFLITYLLLVERQDHGRISLRQFYGRRALRLLPGLVTMIVLVTLYTAFFETTKTTFDEQLRNASYALFYIANWVRAFGESTLGLLGQTWSLSVEEQFYAVWPLLLIGLLVFLRSTSRIIMALLVLIGASAAMRFLLFDGSGAAFRRLYHGIDARAEVLLVGCLVGVLAARGLLPRSRTARRWVAAGGVLAFAWLVIMTIWLPSGPHYVTWGMTANGLASGVLIVSLLVSPDPLTGRVFFWKPVVWFGKLSYSIYLWHYPIILLMRPHLMGLSRPLRLSIIIVAGCAAGVVSYYAVEQPFLKLKDRLRPSA